MMGNICPSFMHAILGFANTLINVYTAQGGNWSVTARSTGIVTGCFAVICLSFYIVYNYWLLGKVKSRHEGELELRRM